MSYLLHFPVSSEVTHHRAKADESDESSDEESDAESESSQEVARPGIGAKGELH